MQLGKIYASFVLMGQCQEITVNDGFGQMNDYEVNGYWLVYTVLYCIVQFFIVLSTFMKCLS